MTQRRGETCATFVFGTVSHIAYALSALVFEDGVGSVKDLELRLIATWLQRVESTM